ncbi:MAG: rod shape-determining protein RodA [Bacillota bacterium]|nr:rod shape-determining protein RodA [Bacillota bacterium]
MNIKRLKFVDKTFLLVLMIILGYGLLILSSAGSSISSDHLYYLKKQAVWMMLGLGIAVLIVRFDFGQVEKFTPYLYGFSVLILVVVLVFGQEVRGTTGWIGFGPLPMLQPSEFTKVLLIISFAEFLNRRKGVLQTFGEMLPCFVYMGIPFLLIMMQPDLGTALVYIALTICMMFVAGANPRILFWLILSAGLVIALALFLHFRFDLWLPLDDYQIRRLTIFVDPYNDGQGGRGAGWNTIQSLIAIGSGGLTGEGLFNGTQVQLNFLPEHHTDFIYAVIGEELGFLGAAAVLVLYGVLLNRAIVIASQAKDFYGTLLVIGVTAMWLFHIFENIGMSIGLMPITGIPLPFLSYGGSSMLTNMLGVGLILNVNIRGKKLVF